MWHAGTQRRHAAEAQQTAADAPRAQQQAPGSQSAESALPERMPRMPAPALQKLRSNGFVVVPASEWPTELTHFYRSCKSDRTPILVTADAALHVSHLVFDWYLRFLEIAHLRGDLLDLTDALGSMMMQYYDDATAPELRQAALHAAAFFSVGKRLLVGGPTSDIPAELRSKIDGELQLIREAHGFAASPLFGYREDYSQYMPRGHYTGSEEFQTFFRAMAWYGRMALRLSPQVGDRPDAARGRQQTLAAVLICRALGEAKVKGQGAMDVWNRIYETTAFFGGQSDDLTALDYGGAATEIYGDAPQLSALGDRGKLDRFIQKARTLREPRLLSTFALGGQGAPHWRETTLGMSFMGQRFAFDAGITQNLVFDKVGSYTGDDPKPFTAAFAGGLWIRGLPRGLDVMAALGFKAAEVTLKREGDHRFLGYEEQLVRLRKELASVPPASWEADLYARRLACLRSLAEAAAPTAPSFMRGQPWALKQVNAALGAWTELRHDTILYTKQPYTAAQAMLATATKGGPPRPRPPPVHGYVEPYPKLYAALACAAESLRDKIVALEFPTDRARQYNLDGFAALLRSLEAIARKEIAGETPTAEEYELIENIASRLGGVLAFPHYSDVTERFMTRMDKHMAVVADVHTDVNSKQVLEQAVGLPMALYAVCSVDGRPTVCKGAVYSYYEFKQPMSKRLTDEQWREMLSKGEAPPLPRWTQAFVAAPAPT